MIKVITKQGAVYHSTHHADVKVLAQRIIRAEDGFLYTDDAAIRYSEVAVIEQEKEEPK